MGCSVSTKRQTSAAVNELFDNDHERDLYDGRKIVRVDELTNAARIGEIYGVMSRAFCGSDTAAPDACFSWVYDPQDKMGVGGRPLMAPPSEERKKWFDYNFTLFTNATMPFGGVYALVDCGTDKVIGAVCTNPPSKNGIHEMGMLAYMGLMSKAGAPPAPGLDRIEALDKVMKKLHKKHTKGSHLYILTFAADPEWQGKGVGTALLQFCNMLADADGVDTYLETCGEKNLGFYAKKGGFQDKEALVVVHKEDTFDITGGLHGMVRPAPNQAWPDGKVPETS